ncbi:trypsin-like peptidase domain-containing protein [Mucilaginibacter sp. AW1-3]
MNENIPRYFVRITGKTVNGDVFNGSGFIVSKKGHIATCFHVVKSNADPSGQLEVYTQFENKPWIYTILDQFEANDVALLEGRVPPSINLENSIGVLNTNWHKLAQIGQVICSYGHSSSKNYTFGQCFPQAISGFSEKDGVVGVTGAINPGDSGGPVLDRDSRIIGIVNQKDTVRDGQGRFLPISLLISLLNKNEIEYVTATPSVPSFIDRSFTEENSNLSFSSKDQIPLQIKKPPALFLGRDKDIQEIKQALDKHPVVIIRSGLGGIGKTSLATTVALSLKDKFPDGILWGRADEEIGSILIRFISSLGNLYKKEVDYLISKRDSDLVNNHSINTGLITYFRDLISQKSTLIILDNVDHSEQVKDLIPASGNSKFLITTRNKLIIDECFELILKPLPVDYSIELFASRLKNKKYKFPIDEFQLKSVVTDLGHLPIAINIAAEVISSMSWTVEEYRVQWEKPDALDLLSDEDNPDESVRKSFSISYESLQDENARFAFRLLAIFRLHSIPKQLLHNVLEKVVAHPSKTALTLIRRGLLEIEDEMQLNYSLHPLMKKYALELLNRSKTEEEQRIKIAYNTAGSWYRDQISTWNSELKIFYFGSLGKVEDIDVGFNAIFYFNLAQAYNESQAILVAIADITTLHGREEFLIKYLNEFAQHRELEPWLKLYQGHYLILSENPSDQAEGEAVLQHLKQVDDLKLSSAALISLAKARIKNGAFIEATKLFEQSKEQKKSITPLDAKGIAYIENELGYIALKSNQPDRYHVAMSYNKKALEIQILANDEKGIAYTYRRIGSIQLWNLKQIDESLLTLKKGEDLARKVGAKLILVLLLIEKAEAIRQKGGFTKSIDILKEALNIAKECDDPFSEAHVLKRLAIIMEKVEHYGDAYKFVEECMTILKRIKPKASEDLKNTYHRLRGKVAFLKEELINIQGIIDQSGETRILRRRLKKIKGQLNLIPFKITIDTF